jgi:regulator of sirC expression with transglutaminase-like and TPR domain
MIGENEFDSKIAELSRTVKFNPQNADAFRNRGLLYGRKGKYALAANCRLAFSRQCRNVLDY